MALSQNHILISVILTILSISPLAAHNCESDTYDFWQYYNPSHKLDLKAPTGFTIAEFEVRNLQSVDYSNKYLDIKVENDRLVFRTTAEFEKYDKQESSTRIALQIEYKCSVGKTVGAYFQDILEANNYDPEFTRSVYEVTVPLPLPKNFDLTPYIDGGQGIVATDYDLVGNTVTFSLESNKYLRIESVPVSNSLKQFRGVVRLQDQILKLADNIELEVRAEDKGVPPRSSTARLVIRPDATVVYNDPPTFKRSFIREDYEPNSENSIVLELIQGTEHEDLEYVLMGDDKEYFELSVGVAKNNATLSMKSEPKPPKGKFFMNVIVEVKRSELLSDECVVLIDLKESSQEGSKVTVEKTFVVIHLEEERVHSQVFPAKIGDCTYRIVSQHPKKEVDIFTVNEATGWIESVRFDREDRELFTDMERPQFKIVLRLVCQAQSIETVDNRQIKEFEDIPFTTDTTYLTVIVDDINDNAPTFTFPKEGDLFAYPVARISERLMISSLLQVSAYDLDADLNGSIRFSVTPNGNFDIDPKTGRIFPLKSALKDENTIQLDIMATDRDGAVDGNESRLRIYVVPVLPYQLSLLQLNAMREEALQDYLDMLLAATGLRVVALPGGYTSLSESSTRQQNFETALRYAVAAFDGQNAIVSSDSLANSLMNNDDAKLSSWNDLFIDELPAEDCTVYPYIVIMAVFIVLFIAVTALAIFWWAKSRSTLEDSSTASTEEPCADSGSVFVENSLANAKSTPPMVRKHIEDVTVDDSTDGFVRSNRLAKSLSDLLIVDESEEVSCNEANSGTQRRKSIRFNENVEKIEIV
ncbi:protocadherin Fat 1-like isoform X2 [Wyeomyia smithii]|uniref:protocadherin Fat 1-like isoform X2 n=1 Tax=Wyeomyia smithii TaxID=174621 RepID=UPI002467E259|nr:protocadherin Fat 1-like isoform X2 [Wyeomyia smithii]